MNPLRQRLVDWLFGFGEPVEDDYVPPAPAPSMVTVPVTDLAPVEEPGATLPDLSSAGVWCIVCQQPLGKSPSDDFCTDSCQHEWMTRFGDPLEKPGLDGILRLANIDTRRVG
jgi:hypothetical protein